MSALSAYVGRTIDYAIIDGQEPPRLSLVGAFGQGLVLTGVLKLAQRFLMLLLTRAGSVTHLPDYGSTFMLDAVIGGWRTVADVQQSFSGALPDIERQLGVIETADDPADEVYAGAALLTVELSAALVQIRVQVVSLAGAQAVVVAPIATVPQ